MCRGILLVKKNQLKNKAAVSVVITDAAAFLVSESYFVFTLFLPLQEE